MEENLLKRVMPNSVEAEQSVIGSMLMDENAVEIAAQMLTPDDFYQKQYKIMFEAMMELYQENKAVDMITVQERLKEKDVPPEISSLEFVRDMINVVPTSANVKYYAQIVAEKAQLRRLIQVTEEIASTCYAGKESLEKIEEDTEKNIYQVLRRGTESDFVPVKDIVLETLEKIEKASQNSGNITGLATGFADLDAKTSGFQPSDLILIAARPSIGKTALALNIAQYMAFRSGKTVAFFSLEMSRDQLMNRLFAMEARVDSQNLRVGKLNDSEWSSLAEAAGTIGKSNLIIDDTSNLSVAELRSRCRKYDLDYNLDIIMIDYLQLMQPDHHAESRQLEISEISRALKGIARELDVPVVAISQLSREVERRPEHRPVLSDLRDSGAIEQDADVVMFLYREDKYVEDTDKKNITEVNIAKHRNGPTGTVELAWLPEYTKYVNLQK